jgi:hypothetical protein
MSAKPGTRSAAEKVVKDIRRRTRRQHSSEEKIRIVLQDEAKWTALDRGDWSIPRDMIRLAVDGIDQATYTKNSFV